MESPDALAGSAESEHPARALARRALRVAGGLWAPLAVLGTAHLVVRLVVLYLQRHSPTLYAPVSQLAVGFGDDLLVCGLLVAPAVAAGLVTRWVRRLGAVGDGVLSFVASAALLFTIGSAVKVAHVGLALMPADLLYWREVPFALDSVRAYLLSPLGLVLGLSGLAALGATSWMFFRALRELRRRLHEETLLAWACALVVLGGLVLGLRHEVQERRMALDEPLENHPLHYVYSRMKDARHVTLHPPTEQVAKLQAYLASVGAEPTGNPDWPTRNRRTPAPGQLTLPPDTNVLIITLEGMGRGPIVHHPEIAPFLAQLEKKGLAFDRHVSTMFRTAGAQLGILCSMLDPAEFFVAREASGVGLRCLPRVLRDAGYHTSWVGGSNGAFDRRKEWLSHNGITHLVGEEDFGPEAHERFSFGVHDEHLFQRLADELDRAQQPFFTWSLTVSNHHPYVQPESFLARHPETAEWSEIDRSYRYVDEQLERFFSVISQRPWFEHTLIVLVGDHSPWGYKGGDPRTGLEFEDVRLRYETELLMLHPRLPPGRHLGLTSHLDIAPTILGLLGRSAETDFLGQNVFDGRPPRTWAFAEDNARAFYVGLFGDREAILRGISSHTCEKMDDRTPGRRACADDEQRTIDEYRETFLLPTEWEVTKEAMRLGIPAP